MYKVSGFLKEAIRKSYFRVDIHLAFPSKLDLSVPNHVMSSVESFLQAASLRGLDIVCFVSDWLHPGQVAQDIIRGSGIDIVAFAGQELVSEENAHILAIDLQQEIGQRGKMEDICMEIYRQGGLAIIVSPNKEIAKKLNKIKDEDWRPFGVEIMNDYMSEFVDADIPMQYELFIASGAISPNDLLNSKANTRTPTDIWVPRIQKANLGVQMT